MTLVERFIEFNGWSSSRKTALITGLSLPVVAGLWLICEIAFAGLPIVDMKLVRLLNVVITAAYLLTFFISLAAAKTGTKAPWIPYLAVMLVGGSIAFAIYLFGTWAASVFALFPISVMVLTLRYDEKVGGVTLVPGGHPKSSTCGRVKFLHLRYVAGVRLNPRSSSSSVRFLVKM